MVIADLDGNGAMDIATGAEDDNVGINRAVVFMNGGAGAFGPALGYVTNAFGTSGVVATDLDCDGALDLALANQDTNNLSVLRNLGRTARSARRCCCPVGTNPETLGLADFDGDGTSDLATANRDSTTVSVIINLTCDATIPGDLDGDGSVGLSDLLTVLSSWGACAGCPADVDGDGTVGLADLLVVLSAWT